MTFLEQRLELGLNYGASYGPRFNTAIATSANGIEQRRAIWSQPLITIQLGDRRVNQTELDYLLAFHASVKGAFAGFRIRDWSDYKSGWQPIGTGNGTLQSWQLIKAYTVAGVTVTRAIAKPIDGTLKVFLDGDEVLVGWSCDYNQGILYTELTGPIAATFDFDVPVRFEQDKIDFIYEAGTGTRKLFTLAPLTCVELRLEPAIYPTLDVLPSGINEVFDLGYDFGTLGGPSFNTAIATNAAEFESRKSYWPNAKGSWDIGDRALIRSELDYFIALFRCARGMAVPFSFKDWQDESTKLVRFAEDRISFRFDAFRSTDEEVIFNLGGVAIGELPPPNLFACRISAPYFVSLSLPLASGNQPRQTATATFNLSDYSGNLLPVVNNTFALDDLAFFVKPGFDVTTAYSVDGGNNRTIYLPDESLVVVDGNLVPPQYGNGHVTEARNNTYIYKGQSFTIPASTGELFPLSVAINGLVGIGVPVQPHNQISLAQLESLGFAVGNEISFKIMHVAHGLGNITLQIDVPQC
jgi:uncharacterized protein (TIGR02217 family)